ncbi:MAG: hypothetical protein ABEJ69_01720 [Candidatus Nanohaloarchaea archaeon]
MKDERPDPDEISETVEEVSEYFSRVGQYDREDLQMEDERELVKNAVGAVSAFYRAAEELDGLYESHVEDEASEDELEGKAHEVGAAWPSAFHAYNTVKESVDYQELNDKAVNAAMKEAGAEQEKRGSAQVDAAPGIASSRRESPLDTVFDAIEDIADMETRYQIAEVYARTASEYMNARDMTHPVELAQLHAEDEEAVEHFREIEAELPETVEEELAAFEEEIEQFLDQN